MLVGKIGLLLKIARAIGRFSLAEIQRGTFLKNIRGLPKMDFSQDMSWAQLLEEQAKRYGDRTFLIFEDQSFSFRQMDENANRVGNYLVEQGGRPGQGVAIFMNNSPQFLDVFFGIQKAGMYAIPVNTSLRGESLLYILNHSEAKFLVADQDQLQTVERVSAGLEQIEKIVVNPALDSAAQSNGVEWLSLTEAYRCSADNPAVAYDKDDICLIVYTSGTTGLPKGVVYRYRKSSVKLISLAAFLLFESSDVLYTPFPLFHANALFVTTTSALHMGARVVLARRFSASRFWDDIRKYEVTSFNTIGAIIPILLKQPEKPTDAQNKVRFVISAACPPELWEKFEKRYGLTIYETYGAVDGGGKTILNIGTGPVGSIGKPPMKMKYRLVDEEMNDVPDGTPGELIFAASKKKGGSVEYFKNVEASSKKVRDGWIFTGDLMRRDKHGNRFFVGRNTESIRIKGENVSAYEVEKIILNHPDVLEAAVYAVPSDLAEDEIMASVSLVEGRSLREADLIDFLKDDLPKFALPRYVKLVEEFPKTETHRIKKKELEALGVISGTYDASTTSYVD
jgi:crotonobetaine/carnitine-CoA ligase